MFYRRCPRCGKYMDAHSVYSKTRSPRLVFTCQCGYTTEKDPAGLAYNNVLDRYKLAKYINDTKTIQRDSND